MTKEEAIKWLDSLTRNIGQIQHQPLWGYEWGYAQALSEISQMIANTPEMSNYINADELTEELEKQREIKEDCEYSKGINAMLDTALMIIHNFTLGDEIAEKGKTK